MPQKLSHEADPKHVPDVVYVSPMEMKPNRVFIGLIAGAIILTIGITGTYLINNFVLTGATPIPSVDIKKASPSAKPASPSAQKDETADWKTYTNKNLGFSIKYPTAYEVREEIDKSTATVSFSTKNFKLSASNIDGPILKVEEGQDISIIVVEFSGSKTLQDLVVEERKTSSDLTTATTTLAGKEAVRIDYGDSTFSINDTILSINRNKSYAVWVNTAKTSPELVNTYETILLTFKFLE